MLVQYPRIPSSGMLQGMEGDRYQGICLRYKIVAVGYNSCDSVEPVRVTSMESSCSRCTQVHDTRSVVMFALQDSSSRIQPL